LSTKRATTVDRLAELARERKDLSKMVSAETQRFNAFYAHTQARVLANKKAYLEELQQQQQQQQPPQHHRRQACNETKLHRSRRRTREVDYRKQQRAASRRDEAATKDRQRSTSSSTALCESADDEASQQTGSTTPRALFTVAESRKRKRPLRACGEDDSGVDEALLVAEGPDDSEVDPEEEQDEEYQDQDDDDDWAASRKQSSPRPRGREEIRHELINKSAGPSSPVTLGARRRTKRTKFDDNWDKRFAQLVTYFNEFGNALIPQKWRENPTLGKWASNQRYLLAKQRLAPSRYARLDQLGFWDTKFSSTSRAKTN
jgi:hypothetical protein